MSKIRSENKRLMGFTIVELLVVIAIMMLLTAILFPALSKARDKVKDISCRANMKQLALGLNMYGTDNGNYYPTSYDGNGTRGINRYWVDLLKEYVNAQFGPSYPHYTNSVYECKADTDRKIGGTELSSYIYVCIFWSNYSRADIFTPQITSPGDTGFITDGLGSVSAPSQVVADIEGGRTGNYRLRPRHSLNTNILYCDGHAYFYKAVIGQSLKSVFEVK